jgi:molybdopterin-binding protein
MLSARNQFEGTVNEINLGRVTAEVIVTVGNMEMASVITAGSVERLGITVGDKVKVVVKSTDVMIEK